jgi:hypothetical protein
VLGVADAFNRGQDNALVAPIATYPVVDWPRVVAEADDRPAADRTDLHRRHGARSVKIPRYRSGRSLHRPSVAFALGVVALLHPLQPRGNDVRESVKDGKDGAADRVIGEVDRFQNIRHATR